MQRKLDSKQRPGRPPKLSPSDKQYFYLWERGENQVPSDLKTSAGVSVHPSTVRWQLSAMVLKGCDAVTVFVS